MNSERIEMRACFFTLSVFLTFTACSPSVGQHRSVSKGAFYTGVYPNLFAELLNRSSGEVQAKVDRAFHQLFYGSDSTERVYYPVKPDMAYILDVLHSDVRSEGMSYGMMIAVQLDKKKEFDRLWKWAKTFMQYQSGTREGYFAWHCTAQGAILDSNAASDGEEWFVTALFFASARWGDDTGIYDYTKEAQSILDAMLTKQTTSDRTDVVTNMFNRLHKQVVFVPIGNADDFTDPSYHVPHFYEIWGQRANKENFFWCDVASASRTFLKKVVHPRTGLAPDYARFDGKPHNPWNGGSHNFQYDAWRVAMNVAVDYLWFRRDVWAVVQSNRVLDFFASQGIGTYGSLYTLDGKKLSDDQSTGLVAMNAVAALSSTRGSRKFFVEELWNAPVPSGPGRYYDGLLYMLGTLQLSGKFRVFSLPGNPNLDCATALK